MERKKWFWNVAQREKKKKDRWWHRNGQRDQPTDRAQWNRTPRKNKPWQRAQRSKESTLKKRRKGFSGRIFYAQKTLPKEPNPVPEIGKTLAIVIHSREKHDKESKLRVTESWNKWPYYISIQPGSGLILQGAWETKSQREILGELNWRGDPLGITLQYWSSNSCTFPKLNKRTWKTIQ